LKDVLSFYFWILIPNRPTMTKNRLHLFMFGIISVFLLSSFSIWRIILDVNTISSKRSKIDSLYSARESAEEMIVMIQEIRALSSSWILLPTQFKNKARLKEILSNRSFITEFKWDKKYDARVQKVVTAIDSLIDVQNETIIGNLMTEDDYEVPVKRMLAEDGYAEIDSKATATLEILYEIYDEINEEMADSKEQLSIRSMRGTIILVILEILMFLAGLIGLIILITSPAWKRRGEAA
jgi:hypothetical protein